jgi:truncated hemoglobin YjbI
MPSDTTPEHDGKVLLVADGGLKPAEGMDQQQVEDKVDDFFTGLGGAAFFTALTVQFYELVSRDEVLAPLFATSDGSSPDWSAHAGRLSAHFLQLFRDNDLRAAWDPRMHRAHTHFVVTREHRLRWLDLMREAGARTGAPEQLFTEFMTLMKIASGEMMAVSRGAAIARGNRLHWDGTPK